MKKSNRDSSDSLSGKITKTEKYHPYYSNLICYCQTVSFSVKNPFGKHYELSSFSEASKYIENSEHLQTFLKRHYNQLSRVYPKGTNSFENSEFYCY